MIIYLNYLRPDISKGITTIRRITKSDSLITELSTTWHIKRDYDQLIHVSILSSVVVLLSTTWHIKRDYDKPVPKQVLSPLYIIYDLTYQKGLRQKIFDTSIYMKIKYYLRPDISKGITTATETTTGIVISRIIYDLTYQKGLRPKFTEFNS